MNRRVAFVTGVTSGIGKAVGELFAERGWRVVGVDKVSPGEEKRYLRFLQLDVRECDCLAEAIASVTEVEGRLDALINNAAVQICRPLTELTLSEWEATMAVNLRAPFWAIREAAPLLAETGGCVVNVGSVHARHTSKEMAAYAASKGGISALTRAAAVELADRQVRVNAVLPGAVDTPMLREGLKRPHLSEQGGIDQLQERQVMGRIAAPREVAEAILFLCDKERASYVNGQTLVVDGAATARLSTE